MTIAEIERRALRALIPPPRLRLSTWVEANIRSPTTAAAPGPLRLYEYQRGILDAIGDPEIERVTVLKAARVGYTVLLLVPPSIN
jgi:phage terminase large subunit GpA-like protein